MKSEPRRIGLFGLFGTGNFGNDGSLEAMLPFLRTTVPEQRLVCICGNPQVVEQKFGIDAVPIYYRPPSSGAGRAALRLRKAVGKIVLWIHAARHLRRIRVLIVPGTGILDDFGAWPLSWPFDLVSWFVLARLMGVKVILVSIGAGPIRHPVSRWLMKAAARTAHYRSYRDQISKAFMQSIGFDARHDPVYPDIAFRLPAPPSTRPPREQGERLTIGVGVMAYCGWRNDARRGAQIYSSYLAKMTAFVIGLLDQGHTVRILMGDQADRRAVDDLIRAVGARRPERTAEAIRFAPARTLHDVMQQIADTDLVVATRYHNVVCALRVGRPTISIGYAVKNDALLAEMGLADYCQSIERLDVALLEAQTTRLIAERAALEARISRAATHFQNSLREQEDRLASLILGEAGILSITRSLDAPDPVT